VQYTGNASGKAVARRWIGVPVANAIGAERSVIMKNQVERFVEDESGATAIEYGLIAALIAVGIIAAARGLGSQIGDTFNTVTTTMKSA
jgi:pilus assembly protein Flp/PilA